VTHRTRPWLIAALSLGLASCGDSPVEPTEVRKRVQPGAQLTAAPPSPSPGFDGRILEYTASGLRGPVPNLHLKVWSASAAGGRVGATPLPDVITDENGGYVFTTLTFINFIETAPDSEYETICPSYPAFAGLRDTPVVKRSTPLERLPPGLLIIGTSALGRVTERVGESVVPVAGATVMFETGRQDPPSTTNSNGFYMICSVVGTDQTRTMTASKQGFHSVTREIFGGWQSFVDFELARN